MGCCGSKLHPSAHHAARSTSGGPAPPPSASLTPDKFRACFVGLSYSSSSSSSSSSTTTTTTTAATLPLRFRLYRLPWEGTSSIVFDAWNQLPYVKVITLELPARLGRAKEKHPQEIQKVARHLAQAIIYPTRLSSLPLPKLLSFLVSTGALSAHVAQNKETVKSLLPLFKADLAAVDAYMLQPNTSWSPSLLLPCPLLVLSTEGDTLAPPSAMEGWKAYTSSTFTSLSLPSPPSSSSSSSSSSSIDRHHHLRPASQALLKTLSHHLIHQPILTKDIHAAQKWFVCPFPKPEANYRLLCLAWAGGNSSLYEKWKVEGCEVVAVELPGRNGRIKETPVKDLMQLVSKIVGAMEVLEYTTEKPLLIFGHSFGAMQALEIARLLRHRGHALPRCLFLSGCPPSDAGWGDTGVSSKTDEGIGKYLTWLGGLTPELAGNMEIMKKILPAIRGDYTAIDSYKHQWADPLLLRVVALTGEKDEAANRDTMYGWRHFVVCCEEEEAMEGGMEGGLGGAPKVYVLKKKGKYKCRREE
ncbi:thioesterase, partial [Nannochloropsis oceanica]